MRTFRGGPCFYETHSNQRRRQDHGLGCQLTARSATAIEDALGNVADMLSAR